MTPAILREQSGDPLSFRCSTMISRDHKTNRLQIQQYLYKKERENEKRQQPSSLSRDMSREKSCSTVMRDKKNSIERQETKKFMINCRFYVHLVSLAVASIYVSPSQFGFLMASFQHHCGYQLCLKPFFLYWNHSESGLYSTAKPRTFHHTQGQAHLESEGTINKLKKLHGMEHLGQDAKLEEKGPTKEGSERRRGKNQAEVPKEQLPVTGKGKRIN